MNNAKASPFLLTVHEAKFVHYFKENKRLGRKRHVIISNGTMTPIGEYRPVHNLREARQIAHDVGAYFLMP